LFNPIKFSDQELKRYLKKDQLLQASRVGEDADNTYALLFKKAGLVVTNFRDFTHTITHNTVQKTIEPHIIPFYKTATRTGVLYVQKDSEKVDNRVYF